MENLPLSNPQYIFLNELKTKFRAYVGGFGSGKTYVGCLDQLIFAIQNPGIKQGYFGPSYPSIKDIYWPTMEEAAATLDITCFIHTTDKEVKLFRGGEQIGTVICRSMDRPQSIVGFKIARALVDEIDTMPLDKADHAWTKIIARMRLVVPGVLNTVAVTCTPEGYLFVYNKFKKNPTESYSMVQASTYENEEYLPPDYISSLYETYPSQLVKAYINGEFVNLTSGAVYEFDRDEHNTHYLPKPREALLFGMDFNVHDMCASMHIEREGVVYAVDELFGLRDTPHMITAIKDKYPDHKIAIYPDASGKGTSSKSASLSDIKLLKSAGFTVRAKSKNPRIKDRVASFNKALEDGLYKVNVERCPGLADSLEQQVYDKRTGQPEKDGVLDNRVDGAGYLVVHRYPIRRPYREIPRLGGM